MEKDQPDSLATVAVGSEKISPTSHYAPSEVYSTAEPPPAYMRPGKTTAVQIARIAAVTLISMTVLLGSFILAASWIQARASCTPESIAAMQATLHLQKLHEKSFNYPSQGEFLKHLQPAALIQEPIDSKNNLQSLSESGVSEKEVTPEVKQVRAQRQNENSKNDNENGDHDGDDDDYDDDELPPVHIKLPLQLDLDDIAGSLIQQARSRVSCVVERRRADEVMDGVADNALDNSNNNNTDPQRFQRLSGERVSILCEAGNPHQEQQEQEMMTPIIVPLGTVQIPVQPQEAGNGYHQYQLHTQYQVPDMQQLPLSDNRGMNHIPRGIFPPELRNLPQINMDLKPPRMAPQQQPMGQQPPMMQQQFEMRQIPIELRHFPVRGMRPVQQQEPRQEQIIAMNFQPQMYQSEEQANMQQPMAPQADSQMPEHRMNPQMMVPQPDQRPPQSPQERPSSPFQGIPLEIRRIIQQVPLEIKNIIQHITGEAKPFPVPVADEARQEQNDQEFKPFLEGARAISLGPFPLPLEVRNLLEHGNMEGRVQQAPENSEQQQQSQQQQQQPQQDVKPFPGPEDQGEEAERNFPIPAEVRRIIHQVVEGRAMPVPRFSLPLRRVESMDIPVRARAEVTDEQAPEQHDEQHNHEQQEQHRLGHALHQQQPQEQDQQEQQEENRPHYVQPRSIRSVPEPFSAHHREKRVRRSCACDCKCPNNL